MRSGRSNLSESVWYVVHGNLRYQLDEKRKSQCAGKPLARGITHTRLQEFGAGDLVECMVSRL